MEMDSKQETPLTPATIRSSARWFAWIAHLNHFLARVTSTELIHSITHCRGHEEDIVSELDASIS